MAVAGAWMIKLRPIKPRVNPINAAAIMRAVRDEMLAIGRDVKDDLEATTRGWKHDVAFSIHTDRSGVIVATDDDVWNMLDQGTRRHSIRPRRKRFLRFSAGGRIVYTKHVNHPGTKPRRWSATIRDRYQRQIALRINEAIGGAIGRH